MAKLPPDKIERAGELRRQGMSYRETAAELGCSASTIGSYWPDSRIKGEDAAEGYAEPVLPAPKVVESGDQRTVEVASPERIVTLEDAVAFAEVDTTTWRVKSWECTSWEVAMKMRVKDGPDRAEKHQLWRISLKLERLFPKYIQDGLEAVYKRFEDAARGFVFDRPHVAARAGGSLMEINIPDVHMGKLCWKPESGDNYDLRIAESAYDRAVAELQARASGFDVEEAVFLIGSDFFHIDTLAATTTGGTHVDVDGRYAKMVEVGVMAVIRAIDRLADACRLVRVVWVPGNHDRLSSYHLAREVAAWFRNDDRVRVDCGPAARKYVRYGCNLIGYTHGDRIKHVKLPLIMATERPRDWAESTCREWHCGHLHTSRSLETAACDEHAGVKIRVVSSLSGTDAWHFENGFVGNARSAEAFIYDKACGLVANFHAVSSRPD